MIEISPQDRSKLSYSWNYHVRNNNDQCLNLFEHQTPTYFDEEDKPVIGITHCTVIGNGDPKPLIGTVKILNNNNEYETIFYKNYFQNLLNTSLTNRELDILRLIVLDNTSKEISKKLFVSHHTVTTHRKDIFKKLNISSTVDLVKFFLSNQLL